MRTTLTIDDDLLEAARVLAAQRRVSIGQIVSELMRKGLRARNGSTRSDSGFPVFDVPANAKPITLETVKQAEDDS